MSIVYLNGQWLPIDAAQVSIMDRGFLFGDGVYEVIPVYSRRPFRLAQHLARLQQSLTGIQLSNPHTETEWTEIVMQMAARADTADQSIYIQATRGPMAVRNHAFPPEADVRPTVVLMSDPLLTPPRSQVDNGIAALTAADIRWLRCDLKVTSLLANCLLRQQAVAAGCVEALLFRDGVLSEGSASSIFVVKNGELLAPIKDHRMLPGITYDVVLELAERHGLPFAVRDISEAETRAADELWMASSTREVLAIVELDGRKVGAGATAGRPGPIFRAMYAWYRDYKDTVMRHG